MSTDFEQVLKLCKIIKTTESSAIEDVATKMFKAAFVVIVPQLVYLFNLSFSLRVFPDCWKRANIIQLVKGGDKTNVSNYRPVSLLPLPVKIIEKIEHAKLTAFLEHNEVILDNQGGFRKKY